MINNTLAMKCFRRMREKEQSMFDEIAEDVGIKEYLRPLWLNELLIADITQMAYCDLIITYRLCTIGVIRVDVILKKVFEHCSTVVNAIEKYRIFFDSESKIILLRHGIEAEDFEHVAINLGGNL